MNIVDDLREEAENHHEGSGIEVLLRVAADEIERLQAKNASADGACLAAYRAWVQESGSSQFVKDEAKRLILDYVKPHTGPVSIHE